MKTNGQKQNASRNALSTDKWIRYGIEDVPHSS